MDKKELAAKKFKERTAAKRFKLPEGDTTFRVLPNKRGLNKAEYIEYAMHSNVGARKAYLRCGKNMAGEGECWLCDTLIPKLEKSGKSSHKALAEALKRKECFAVQIIYKAGDEWVGPTVWEMSTGIANKLLNVMSRRDVSHPETGYNLTISRKGTTMTSTKYGDIDRDDEKSEVPEELLAKLKPFGEVLRKYDEKVQQTEYYGHEQTEDEAEEEEERPKKKPAEEEEEEETPKKKAKKPAEEEEEEEAEPEEEEKPKKKKPAEEEEEPEPEEEEEKPKKKAKKPAEEEDEGEETEEDIPDLQEEEEEKPKPKKKPKDEEEEESEPEEDEEEVKPKKKVKKPVVEEDEEEESKPKKKPKPPADEED
jgi:hypothetical protein